MKKTRLCFIATEWGGSEGGISVFNLRLVTAVSHVAEVHCIVFRTPAAPVPSGVNIHVIDNKIKDDERPSSIHNVVPTFIDWWIGHDVHTGSLANRCRRELELSCVLNHMDYLSYKPFERDGEASRKSYNQEHIFSAADAVAAVGPKLQRSVVDLARHTNSFQLNPGAEDFPLTPPITRFSIMISGRLQKETDPIKQQAAAVLAFAECVKERSLGDSPILTIVGADEESFRELESLARSRIRGSLLLSNVGYVQPGTDYEDLLCRQSVVLVPSIYEGFSLVGWEALSAGVPIILSNNTGLAEFVKNEHVDKAVIFVDIRGHFAASGSASFEPNEADIATLKEAIISSYKDISNLKTHAQQFRDVLRSRFKWDDSAASFVSRLQDIQLNRFYSTLLGTHHTKRISTAGVISTRSVNVSFLAEELRSLSQSVVVPAKEQAFLSEGNLQFSAEDILSKIVESWNRYSWELYISYSQKENLDACIDWLLGITLPAKAQQVFEVGWHGISKSDLQKGMNAAIARSRPNAAKPHIKNSPDHQLVAKAVSGLSLRIADAIASAKAPSSWLLALDPRLRVAIDVDTRAVYWRKHPVPDFDVGET